MASILNFSALMFFVPFSLLVLLVLGFLIYSPLGTPLFKSLAAWCLSKKKYAESAWLYSRVYHWQELMEGSSVFARQAAFAYEQAGNLRLSLEFYEKGEDWNKVGQLLMEMGKTEQALALFKEKKLPARLAFYYEQNENYLGAGELYELELNNSHKALRFYEKGLQQEKLPPLERIRARFLLARVCFHLDKKEESYTHYGMAETLISRLDAPLEDMHVLALERAVQALFKNPKPQS